MYPSEGVPMWWHLYLLFRVVVARGRAGDSGLQRLGLSKQRARDERTRKCASGKVEKRALQRRRNIGNKLVMSFISLRANVLAGFQVPPRSSWIWAYRMRAHLLLPAPQCRQLRFIPSTCAFARPRRLPGRE